MKQVESDRCECDICSQTPKHVLMECPLHATGRRELMKALNEIEGLCGRVQDYDVVLQEPQAIRYIAKFMQQTGLLQQFRFAQLILEEDEEDTEPGNLLVGLELDKEDDGTHTGGLYKKAKHPHRTGRKEYAALREPSGVVKRYTR
ncbi:hypothetical protein BJX99DRAFT_261624 [Aspergillus californicus]